MSLPKSSKLVCSFKDAITTPSSSLDTITGQPGMQQRQSYGWKGLVRSTPDTRQQSSVTYHFPRCNLHFMNKSKDLPRVGLVVMTLASGSRSLRLLRLVGWRVF